MERRSGSAVYAIGESFSALFANRVVADADVIADYYREPLRHRAGRRFRTARSFRPRRTATSCARLGVEPGNYILYVSRFEPENNPLEVVLRTRAWEWGVGVGEAPLPTPTPDPHSRHSSCSAPPPTPTTSRQSCKRHASDRILFPGALYGADYRTLQRNALIYIQATEVGGTHPAMIEAMASGGCVLAHDTPENREVGGDAVGYFRLRPVRDAFRHTSRIPRIAGIARADEDCRAGTGR